MEIPYKVHRHAQHRDITQHVEDRRGNIQLVDVETGARHLRNPDLRSRLAQSRGYDQKADIKGGVDYHQEDSEVVGSVALSGTKDTFDEEHNRKLGGK